MLDPERTVVFAIAAQGLDFVRPTVVVGIPAAAWEHMLAGNSNSFDLTKFGVPVQIVLFGGPDRDAVVAMLRGHMGDPDEAVEHDFMKEPGGGYE